MRLARSFFRSLTASWYRMATWMSLWPANCMSSLVVAPLMAAMVAISAVFAMRHMRGRKMGLLVLGAFGCGIGLFFLRNLAQVLGDNGGIPPALAGWAPPIVALLFALGALLRLEDG